MNPAALEADPRRCISCGYDLTGLPADAACSECGTPVAASLAGGGLRHREPEYIDRLRRGAMLAHIAILTAVAVIVLGFFAAIVVSNPGIAGGFLAGLIQLFVTFGGLAPGVIAAIGWWMLTTPDPARSRFAPANLPRQTARWTSVISLGLGAILTVLSLAMPTATHFPTATGGQMPPGRLAVFLGFALLYLCDLASWVTHWFSGVTYIKDLASWMASDAIVRQARRRIWLCPLFFLAGFIFCGIGPLVAVVLYYGLLINLRKELGVTMLAAIADRAPGPAEAGTDPAERSAEGG